jgi:hypothetical protein
VPIPVPGERDSPLSIIVGVTVHRDPRLEDEPRLKEVFRSTLFELGRRYPHSSQVVLSALAEGADRLAARTALDLGLRLVVPLPMPTSLYEEDFTTPGSLEEFRELLSRASGVVHLPLLPGTTVDMIRGPGRERDREYAKVGAYIARHSQVFVAFWDGTPETADTLGGTAQTVTFRLHGVPAVYSGPARPLALETAEGPVLHIETPRRRDPASRVTAGATHLLLPHDGLHDSFDQLCARLDIFNGDAVVLRGQLDGTRPRSRAQLLSSDVASAPSLLRPLPPSCQRIADQYATADGLALHFGGRTRWTWKRVFLYVGAAALLFHLHSAFHVIHLARPASFLQALGTLPWFLLAFIALSGFTATWIYGRAEKHEYQTKYQDYRALAEALRIQFYWRIAGVPDPVVETYLRKQRSELEWIRSALKSCDVLTAATTSAAAGAWAPLPEQLRFITLWIEDQRRYFASKARSEERTLRHEAATVKWLLRASGVLSVGFAFVLALPFLSTVLPLGRLGSVEPTHLQYEVVMILIPFMALAAGLLDGYGRQVARAEHVRQFTRMSELFGAGERELKQLMHDDHREAAAALVRSLGLEALDENGDWLILHRERPLEIPAG